MVANETEVKLKATLCIHCKSIFWRTLSPEIFARLWFSWVRWCPEAWILSTNGNFPMINIIISVFWKSGKTAANAPTVLTTDSSNSFSSSSSVESSCLAPWNLASMDERRWRRSVLKTSNTAGPMELLLAIETQAASTWTMLAFTFALSLMWSSRWERSFSIMM